MKAFILFLFFLFTWFHSFSQSSNAPLNHDYYRLIDRYELKQKSFSPFFHSSVKAYNRQSIANWADTLLTDDLSRVDRFNLQYLAVDNWEYSEKAEEESKNPIWNTFYRTKSDLFHVSVEDFDLHVNPVLYLQAGKNITSNENDNIYINTRGAEIRGLIGKKVGFYSYIGENQAVYPQYVKDYISTNQVVPGEGFWKRFKDNGVDYFTARGYFSLNAAKVINLQFGHDRFFIGNGYRSMILSDFGNNYLFLKLNTKVWKLNYMNLFTEMTADAPGTVSGSVAGTTYPKKYVALHHLSLNITKNFNLGIFESVVFGKADANGNSNFNLQYLNPIIFYRSLEQHQGSEDNAILGADFKWLFIKNWMLYGQLLLDEFLLKEVRAGNGWWANKYAGQIGVKYIDALGISNLDLQYEANIARPYTYTHSDPYSNYAHYRQPLAHPLGANFIENVAIARFQPIPRLNLTGKIIAAAYGADTLNSNWGGNILKDYTTREQDYNNKITQGIKSQLVILDFTSSYQFKHNLFADLKLMYRQVNSDVPALERKQAVATVSIRWNIPAKDLMF